MSGHEADGRRPASMTRGVAQTWFVVPMVLAGGIAAHGFLALLPALHGGLLVPWADQSPAPFGFLAAVPLFGGRISGRREMVLALLMGAVIVAQALAGMAAAILLCSHWWPAGPANALAEMAPFIVGTMVALPTIMAAQRRLRPASETDGEPT